MSAAARRRRPALLFAALCAQAVSPASAGPRQATGGCAACTVGTASWVGRAHQGLRTASGERFDTAALTAAHPSLPFGSRVRVVNLANERTVVVRINDRGPFNGRAIDLSEAAAREIGMIAAGTAQVRIEPI